MAYPDGAAQVFATATRITTLDPNGFAVAGANTFTSNTLLKATFAPNKETGVDLVTINANGDISTHFKHGDMPKYYDMTIQLASPDPVLTAILSGGTILTSSATALGVVTGAATQAYSTLGTLAAGVYGYRVSQYNAFGETLAASEITATTTGTTGSVVVAGMTLAAGAVGTNLYGRTPGGEQLLYSLPNIGSQTTNAASGTGSPTSLTVTALTKPIPAGFTFQLSSDTNSPKIVFTTTAAAGVGATALAVTVSQSITTTITTAATINPAFQDTGALTPFGSLPTADTSAGPGSDTGYQSPALAVVGNPYGVSMEFWGKAILNGTQASYLPYWRWVVPGVKNLMHDSREFSATLQSPQYMGQCFENPNWGSGPVGDWPFDSTKVFQYARASAQTLPTAGLAPVAATY